MDRYEHLEKQLKNQLEQLETVNKVLELLNTTAELEEIED